MLTSPTAAVHLGVSLLRVMLECGLLITSSITISSTLRILVTTWTSQLLEA